MTWATLTVEGRMVFHEGIPTLKDLQDAVGGYVDAVACRIAGAAATMWLADEGKLTADPERNWKADVICPLGGDWIAGNVAFTGGVGPEGETLALSDAQGAELRRIDRDVHVIVLDKWSPRGVVIG
jgi:hypothetical protein